MSSVRIKKASLMGVTIVVFALLYSYGAVQHLKRVNTDMGGTDQSAYMNYAEKMHETRYAYIYDGARMPVYPFLQSLFYKSGMSDEEFFVQGKYLNIVLSFLILLCLFLIIRSYLPLLETTNLMLITTFTVFIFKAAYFHCALLFYFFNFCSFLLMCRMIIKPTWKLGVITGVALGITYLTKASILPGLMLFLLFMILEVACNLYRRLTDRARITFQAGRNLLSVGLVILFFVVTIYPFISNSKRIFGSYFYNVNTYFSVWYDSLEELKKGTRAHGDRVGWPDMPPELIPGPIKYLKEHSTGQIIHRVYYGLRVLVKICAKSYGYFKYVFIFFIFSLVIIFLNFRKSIGLASKHLFLLLFCLSYFISYLLSYAWWYAVICSGDRLVLAQFLPFMFVIYFVLAMENFRHTRLNIKGVHIGLLSVFNKLVLCGILFEVYFVVSGRILAMYGGN